MIAYPKSCTLWRKEPEQRRTLPFAQMFDWVLEHELGNAKCWILNAKIFSTLMSTGMRAQDIDEQDGSLLDASDTKWMPWLHMSQIT